MASNVPKCEKGEHCEHWKEEEPTLLPANYLSWEIWNTLSSCREHQVIDYQYLGQENGKQYYKRRFYTWPNPLQANNIKALCDSNDAGLGTLNSVYIIESEIYPALLKKAQEHGRN